MALPDLTGQNIQDTYQRVIQIDGSLLYNGTGSLITILPTTASHAVSASYAVSASHEIIKEVSSSFADTASYVNPLNQDVFITGSTNISGSTTLSNSDLILVTDPTQWDSGNIGGELKLTRLNSSRVAVRIGRTSTGNGDDGEIEIFRDGISRFKFTGNGNNYINPTGLGSNLGIGTTSPQAKLHVFGQSILGGNTTIAGYLTISANSPGLLFSDSSTTDAADRQWIMLPDDGTFKLRASDGTSYFNGGNALEIYRSGSTIESVTFPSGSIGIGTTSPQAKLHVSGTVQFDDVLTLTPQDPLPIGVPTGSFAVSSSSPPKPYFYDGTNWNALY